MMTRFRIDLQDLLFGLFLVAVATGTLVATRNLTVGHAADMGPGYMPRVVALALLGFGLFFTGRGFWGTGRGIAAVELRPLLAILASVGVFALAAERLGLAIVSVVTVVFASLATREGRLLETVPFAVALSGAAVLLFVKLLGLPIPIWPR
ncbi:tripartite tricarboxylate transporter TctB family protein [Bradyrhizobium sp. CB3481]|uniref:tripartite tricarboxylate transporter TctB family protein n=1 Tax=Bradyrhizobium sp. CB3481 TaxID=3039158 RepID=UPI0024B1EBA5|nr:tripartite tricarboxylate transporter TctB family protein [Bradyrhizobium sp. CB3481]WFU19330.1 tripartite tricarboxylate transporter TctB family protein [Bradyrhizobium sp. CB3481]